MSRYLAVLTCRSSGGTVLLASCHGGVVLAERITVARAGVVDPQELVGELRRTAVLVPVVEDGFMSAVFGGVRWVYTFTDEEASMLFPPVAGIVPDAVAVDVGEDGCRVAGGAGAAR